MDACFFCPGKSPSNHPLPCPPLPLGHSETGQARAREPLRSWILSVPLLGAQPINWKCFHRLELPEVGQQQQVAGTGQGRGTTIPRAQASGTRSSGFLAKSPPPTHLTEASLTVTTRTPLFDCDHGSFSV